MRKPEWFSKLRRYEGPSTRKSIVQILTSFIPYLVLLTALFLLAARGSSYWIILPLSVLAAGFQVRIFIILHDCAHSSFFRSHRACTIIGHLCSLITFYPFEPFQRSHIEHHATVANLEERGKGDVWTLTVGEYFSANRWKRWEYRIYRNPFIMFGFAPALLFLLFNRIPLSKPRWSEAVNIILIDLLIGGLVLAAYLTIGIGNFFIVQLPIVYIAGAAGIWLFFIQHQFRNVYWAHDREWDPYKAAMQGSSFYRLPFVLRWFSGSIGYHHIHHLQPRIPNYRLDDCQARTPELHEIAPITLFKSLESLFLHLWDENTGTLVSFAHAKREYSTRMFMPADTPDEKSYRTNV